MQEKEAGVRPVIIALPGEWDLARADELDNILAPAREFHHIIIDMSETTYADSTCLGRFVRMRHARHDKGLPPVRFVLPSPHIRKLFDLVGFDKLWPIFGSLDEALSHPAS